MTDQKPPLPKGPFLTEDQGWRIRVESGKTGVTGTGPRELQSMLTVLVKGSAGLRILTVERLTKEGRDDDTMSAGDTATLTIAMEKEVGKRQYFLVMVKLPRRRIDIPVDVQTGHGMDDAKEEVMKEVARILHNPAVYEWAGVEV